MYSGKSLQYFTDQIRDDTAVVKLAVSGNGGLALAYASARLCADVNIVVLACERNDLDTTKKISQTAQLASMMQGIVSRGDQPHLRSLNQQEFDDVKLGALPVDGMNPNQNLHPQMHPQQQAIIQARGYGLQKHIEHPLLFASQSIQASPNFIRKMMHFYLPYYCHKAVVMSFSVVPNDSNETLNVIARNKTRLRVGNTPAAIRLILEFARFRFSNSTNVLLLANPMARIDLEMEIEKELILRDEEVMVDNTLSAVSVLSVNLKGLYYTKEHVKNSNIGKLELEQRRKKYQRRRNVGENGGSMQSRMAQQMGLVGLGPGDLYGQYPRVGDY